MTHQQVDNDECPYRLAGELGRVGVLYAVDDRKLNSFCCACCRLIWDFLVPETRSALELAERFVKGLASSEELTAERIRMWKFLDALPNRNDNTPEIYAIRAVICCLGERERDTDDPDPNYEWDKLTWTMDFCNWVKPNQRQAHYRIMLEVFGSSPEQS